MKTIRDPDYLEVVSRLRRIRKGKRLSQKTLAAKMGMPQSFISKVETGERRLDLVECCRWCVALGVSLQDILPSPLRAAVIGPPVPSSAAKNRRTARDL